MAKERAIVNGTWQHILMVNYEVDQSLLAPLVPKGTQLRTYQDRCFVTLTGLVFSGISVFGVKVPFHQFIPEVNLRFYVEPHLPVIGRGGAVFVGKIISRRMMALAANVFFKEHYTLRMVEHGLEFDTHHDLVSYQVKGSEWFQLRARLRASKPEHVVEGTKKAFFLRNFCGYTGRQSEWATYYRLDHPPWQTKLVVQCDIMMDFEEIFGKRFSCLNWQKPDSAYYTIGSGISISGLRPLANVIEADGQNGRPRQRPAEPFVRKEMM